MDKNPYSICVPEPTDFQFSLFKLYLGVVCLELVYMTLNLALFVLVKLV